MVSRYICARHEHKDCKAESAMDELVILPRRISLNVPFCHRSFDDTERGQLRTLVTLASSTVVGLSMREAERWHQLEAMWIDFDPTLNPRFCSMADRNRSGTPSAGKGRVALGRLTVADGAISIGQKPHGSKSNACADKSIAQWSYHSQHALYYGFGLSSGTKFGIHSPGQASQGL